MSVILYEVEWDSDASIWRCSADVFWQQPETRPLGSSGERRPREVPGGPGLDQRPGGPGGPGGPPPLGPPSMGPPGGGPLRRKPRATPQDSASSSLPVLAYGLRAI